MVSYDVVIYPAVQIWGFQWTALW